MFFKKIILCVGLSERTSHLACLKAIRDDCLCYLLSVDSDFNPFCNPIKIVCSAMCVLLDVGGRECGVKGGVP